MQTERAVALPPIVQSNNPNNGNNGSVRRNRSLTKGFCFPSSDPKTNFVNKPANNNHNKTVSRTAPPKQNNTIMKTGLGANVNDTLNTIIHNSNNNNSNTVVQKPFQPPRKSNFQSGVVSKPQPKQQQQQTKQPPQQPAQKTSLQPTVMTKPLQNTTNSNGSGENNSLNNTLNNSSGNVVYNTGNRQYLQKNGNAAKRNGKVNVNPNSKVNASYDGTQNKLYSNNNNSNSNNNTNTNSTNNRNNVGSGTLPNILSANTNKMVPPSGDFSNTTHDLSSYRESYNSTPVGYNSNNNNNNNNNRVLTEFEREEIKVYYPEVYFTGLPTAKKVKAVLPPADEKEVVLNTKVYQDADDVRFLHTSHNYGFDDENNHYRVVCGDHLLYRYEIDKELGRGTFGVVVRAYDRKFSSPPTSRLTNYPKNKKDNNNNDSEMYPVAIKIIKNKGNYVRQAQQELSVLEQLNRNDPNDERNVIRVLDNFFFRNHFFIVFELLNADLYSICYHNKFRPFPSEVIFDVAAQVLEALKFTASEGIIHCDLKPENIVLNQREDSLVSCVSLKKNPSSAKDLSRCVLNNKFTGSQMNQYAYKRLKVIDFGSAFVEANAYKQKKFTYIQSRYYRAPEIILGIDNYNYDYSIDVWSFGCILCELKNGFPIFPAQCEGELLERITEYFGDFSSDIIRRSKRAGRFFNKIGDTDEYEMKPNLSKKKRKRHPPCSRTLEAFLGIKGTANHNDDDDGSDSDGPHNNPTKPIQYGSSSNNNKEDTNISSLLLQQEFAFLDLIRRCLVIDPKKRITAAAALEHPWIKNWFTIRTATAGKVKIVYK